MILDGITGNTNERRWEKTVEESTQPVSEQQGISEEGEIKLEEKQKQKILK